MNISQSNRMGHIDSIRGIAALLVAYVLVNPPYNLEIDAYNLGVPGYNTFHEFHLLNQAIDQYAPALVVLGYVMNDAEPQRNVPERPSVRYKYVNSWLLAFIKEQLNYYVYEGKPILHGMLPALEHSTLWLAIKERPDEQRRNYG